MLSMKSSWRMVVIAGCPEWDVGLCGGVKQLQLFPEADSGLRCSTATLRGLLCIPKPHRDDVAVGMMQDGVGRRAQQQFQSVPAMGADHDQIRLLLIGNLGDFLFWHAPHQPAAVPVDVQAVGDVDEFVFSASRASSCESWSSGITVS